MYNISFTFSPPIFLCLYFTKVWNIARYRYFRYDLIWPRRYGAVLSLRISDQFLWYFKQDVCWPDPTSFFQYSLLHSVVWWFYFFVFFEIRWTVCCAQTKFVDAKRSHSQSVGKLCLHTQYSFYFPYAHFYDCTCLLTVVKLLEMQKLNATGLQFCISYRI